MKTSAIVFRTAALSGVVALSLVVASCRTKPGSGQGARQVSAPAAAVELIQNGIRVNTGTQRVCVQFHAEDTVQVVKQAPGAAALKPSLAVVQKAMPDLNLEFQEDAGGVALSSGKLRVQVSTNDGVIRFSTRAGQALLRERDAAVFTPLEVPYEKNAFSVRQDFRLTPEEGVYGLGQHQSGHMNYRGRTVKLVQANTEAVTPFLISTLNYGVLWDNYSKTIFTDEQDKTSLWSDVADGVDYYFIGGDSMDGVIAGYRRLTGQAPMYGKWAYGYWQSKEHYHTGEEILGVARQYRERQIPIDNIIQDWNYWGGNNMWSGMVFETNRYPNPKGMVQELHDLNYHVMISIWPGLGPDTAIFKEMDQHGYLYPPFGWAGFKYYDAYNPKANDIYWKHLKKGLYHTGIDAWWIDSTEPDVVNALTKEGQEYEMKRVGTNYLGSWARYLNPFSLVMTESLYQHLRQETEQERAYILTRSTFAGQQRAAATTWSGDIGANWDVYRNQISAGLNHCMAGIPYWTFDIGAFVIGAYEGVFSKGGKDPAYQELYTRMFQLGAFTPIFRSHGSETPREIWEFGDFTNVLIQFDHLRYRLLPYIYSLAWQVTDSGYTIMRGLPMDFAADKNTYSIGDQFLFGPALMVCPVTEYMLHRPPENSVRLTSEHFRTPDGQPGLRARYYGDADFKTLVHEQVEPEINLFWYTGWPPYISSPKFSMRWEGKLIPTQTGTHRFHMKSFGPKRLFLDGKEVPNNYVSTEAYTVPMDLEAGKEYDFAFETANTVLGAFRSQLFWKTPEIFEREKIVETRPQTRNVYLPEGASWTDFWTGQTVDGGQSVDMDAPIDKLPLLVRAGSIVPMGPFLQYAAEKPADPIELRVYAGADGAFTLYEDEGDNYNYERGIYATIQLRWDDARRRLTIDERKGSFPGMLQERTFQIVLVRADHGTGIDITPSPDQVVPYQGEKVEVQF